MLKPPNAIGAPDRDPLLPLLAFTLLAAVGLIRLPDVYMRSHAAGKAATLGVCCVLLGAAFGLGGLLVIVTLPLPFTDESSA